VRSSVGKGARNAPADVAYVQGLLNRHLEAPDALLKVDGLAGPKTIGEIVRFQKRLGILPCDGRVDAVGKTIYSLQSIPKCTKPPCGLSKFITVSCGFWETIGTRIKPAPEKPSNVTVHLRVRSPIALDVKCGAIAWGAKVGADFKARVIEICQELQFAPDYLMACMAFETEETFKADILNRNGSGAVGLIQFMPTTAAAYGTSSNKLSKMTSVDQLDYVRRYFLDYKGRLTSLEDVYMVIFWPRGVGKGEDQILFNRDSRAYKLNSGLDRYPADGNVTKRECSIAVRRAYEKGLRPGFIG